MLLQQSGIHRIEAYIEHFRKTGDLQSRKPDLGTAARELMASHDAFVRLGNGGAAAFSMIKLGDAQRLRDDVRQAMQCYERGLRLAKQANVVTNQALALLGQGRAEAYVQKDYPAAAKHFGEAAQIAADLPDSTHLFNALSGLGSVEVSQGNLIGAADTYSRAFTLLPKLKDQTLYFYAYLDRGEVYQKLGEKCDYQRSFQPCYEQLDLAKKDYEAALEIARKLGYNGLAATTEHFLGELEMRRSMYKSTERLSQKLEQSGIFHPRQPGDVSVSDQFTTSAAGMPAGLTALLQQAGVLTAGDSRSHFLRGQFFSMQGQDKQALPEFLKATELLEADRRRLQVDSMSSSYMEDRINFYYAPIELLLQERRFEEAFALMERSRARAMTDLIFSRKLGLAKPEDAALFAQLQTLRSRIGALQQELFARRSRADSAGRADQLQAKESEIARLQAEYAKVTERMSMQAPKIRQLVASEVVPLGALQAGLRQTGCDVLYYLVLEQAVILWHINGESVHVRSVFLPRTEVINKVSALQKTLTQPEFQFDETTAKELFLYLIQPALTWIKSRHLVIIPHEDLHYVPFQALLDPAGLPLGERFQVTYAPNATLLAQLKATRPLKQDRLLAVGDSSIEKASGEIRSLRLEELYPGRHQVLMDATETDFKQAARQFEVLHLSVHGAFDAREPLLSCVMLAAGGADDGQLTAAEIFGLPLDQAELVVLSACETGRAVATHANEILGLQRALLYAGAQALVLAAWKVDYDATALWMQTFYREAQQKPPPEAARLSLIEVRKKYPHPYHWAPFQLVGK